VSRPAAIMGLADGTTTGIGLALGMAVAGEPGRAIWLAGLSGGLAAFPGMASGRYQSQPDDGIPGAAVCGLATTAGSVLVVLPYLLTSGRAALTAAAAVTLALCAVVAVIRDQAGWRAWALSYGITAVAAGLCLAGGLIGA
jgi:VIT1/CCC1 family predicted Fe2+/Mn2+ transporter